MLTLETLNVSMKEAKRFIRAAMKVRKQLIATSNPKQVRTRETVTVRMASVDLRYALADVLRPEIHDPGFDEVVK